jgi:hypothetical protein
MNAWLANLALGAAVLLAGCATTEYSRLEGTRYYRATIDTYPVMVVKVDGESTGLHLPVLVKPGPHTVTVQTYPNPLQRLGKERSIALDVQRCTRYYLVAVKAVPLSTDFEVKVDFAEPIPGCAAPKG